MAQMGLACAAGTAHLLWVRDLRFPHLVGLALRAVRERALNEAQTTEPLDRLREEPFSCPKP